MCDWFVCDLANQDWQGILAQAVGEGVSGGLKFYLYFGWVMFVLWAGAFLVWVTSRIGRTFPTWMGTPWFRWGVVLIPAGAWPFIADYNFPGDRVMLIRGIGVLLAFTMVAGFVLAGTMDKYKESTDRLITCLFTRFLSVACSA